MVATTLAIGLAALLAVGCSSSGSTHAPDTTAASTSASTTPPPTTADAATRLAQDKADITATIVELHRLYVLGSENPSNPPPAIADLVGADLAAQYRRTFLERVATRQNGHLPSNSLERATASSITVEGDRATAKECTVSDFVLTDASTGRVLNDKVGTTLYDVTLERDGSSPHSWRVLYVQTRKHWEGVAGCAQ
jgi:hypothetical protein